MPGLDSGNEAGGGGSEMVRQLFYYEYTRNRLTNDLIYLLVMIYFILQFKSYPMC